MAALQPTQQIHALRNSQGDLSTKTSDNEGCVRLDSPEGDVKHSSFGVRFDGGITVLQLNRMTGDRYIRSKSFPFGSN